MMFATAGFTRRMQLHEESRGATGRVDRTAGVIRGVKIIGRVSKNGREYTANALTEAVRLYEGRRVLVDHPSRQSPDAERSVADHFGTLRNVRREGDGVFADLYYIRSHRMAEQIAEMAETQPNQLGLSHNAEGEVRQYKGRTIVEAITSVRSVDLVLQPATTAGLFESVETSRHPRSSFRSNADRIGFLRSGGLRESAQADSKSFGIPDPDKAIQTISEVLADLIGTVAAGDADEADKAVSIKILTRVLRAAKEEIRKATDRMRVPADDDEAADDDVYDGTPIMVESHRRKRSGFASSSAPAFTSNAQRMGYLRG